MTKDLCRKNLRSRVFVNDWMHCETYPDFFA